MTPMSLHIGEASSHLLTMQTLEAFLVREVSTKASFGFAEVRLLLLVPRGPQRSPGQHP